MAKQGGNWGVIHRAVVTSIEATGVMVEIPALAAGGDWGPIPSAVPDLAVDDAVLLGQISTSRDTLIVIGRVPGRASDVTEIPGLSATIAALLAADTSQVASIGANTGAIAGHGTRLTTDEAAITANTSAIAANTSAIAGHGTRLTTDEAAITANVTALAGKAPTVHTHEATDITSVTKHDARYEQTFFQLIPTGADTKITFDTPITTCADVVASGIGNTDFLLVRAGLWRCSACVGLVSGTSGYRHLFLTTGTVLATLANRFVGATDNVGGGPSALNVSTEIRVAANTSVCAGYFQNNGGSLATEVAFGHMEHIAFTWIRP